MLGSKTLFIESYYQTLSPCSSSKLSIGPFLGKRASKSRYLETQAGAGISENKLKA